MAETEIGLFKYHLACMSMEGCTAGFSRDQQDLFVDARTRVALDRIEQEAVLRLASIENLETCPFCPFAAECPPVEVDKEFRCQNPECMEVSCRQCRKATHIPQTCAEAERETGQSARREIEEAMSAAMIRKCNKCKSACLAGSARPLEDPACPLFADALDNDRRHAFHQGEWVQQDDVHPRRLLQHPVLRMPQVLRLQAL